MRLAVVAFALDGAKDPLREGDGCGPRPVAVFDSEQSPASALGVRIEHAFGCDVMFAVVVSLNTRLVLSGEKDVRWGALEARARSAVLPLRTVMLASTFCPDEQHMPPLSAQ